MSDWEEESDDNEAPVPNSWSRDNSQTTKRAPGFGRGKPNRYRYEEPSQPFNSGGFGRQSNDRPGDNYRERNPSRHSELQSEMDGNWRSPESTSDTRGFGRGRRGGKGGGSQGFRSGQDSGFGRDKRGNRNMEVVNVNCGIVGRIIGKSSAGLLGRFLDFLISVI